MAVNPSEELVERLCSRSFLSLWSYANPCAGAGKELCDVLVVYHPDIVIFSVKDLPLGDGNEPASAERWRRKAVEKSIKQIYGAERALRREDHVTRQDGTGGVPLPPLDARRIHRVAVALGSRGQVGLECGDFGRGYVHVFDELALERILGELDTVVDFTHYLRTKEDLASDGTYSLFARGEENLLAVYLHCGRRFPQGQMLVVQPESWEAITAKPEWVRRKQEDRESYVWDGLIETVAELTGVPGSVGSQRLEDRDAVLRIMAREDRFARQVLAKRFNRFMAQAARRELRARIAHSQSGVVYVFLATDRADDRATRGRELTLRCFVARGLQQDARTVIGLATERYQQGGGFSIDVVRLTIDDWTAEHQQRMLGIQEELGFFKSPRLTRDQEDEFPLSR